MKYTDVFGKRLSKIVFGADRIRTADMPSAFEFLDTYVSLGGNFIDTARIYGFGDCESALGGWLVRGGNRSKVFLGTKGGHPDISDMHKGRLDRRSLEYDMKKSLEALRTEYVDMYYLHRDDTTRPVGDILETLNSFIENGLAKHIGASNWSAGRIEEAQIYAKTHGLTGFSADQPQFSLAYQCACPDDTLVCMDGQLYEYHKKTNLVSVSYSSQAKGYFMKLQRGEPLSGLARLMFDCEENRRISEKINRSGADACAVSLAFVLNQSFPSFAIAGSSSIAQLKQTMACADADTGCIDAADLRVIG